MTVVVLHDVIVVVIIDVEISAIAAPALVGIGLIVLHRTRVAIPFPKSYRSAPGAVWAKPAVVHDIRLQQSVIQLSYKNSIAVDIVRRRILHGDIASQRLGHPVALDPPSTSVYQYSL